MGDTSIKKVNAGFSPKGQLGQTYLASGKTIAMRLWDNEPGGQSYPPSLRGYETVGYVIQGRAELQIEGQTILLERGDCWVVPKGARHSYTILDPFTAVEATHPPAHIQNRDAPESIP